MKNCILLIFLFVSLISFSQCENDSVNPWFENLQFEPTISCFDDINSVFPVAYDLCDDSVEIAYYEEVMDGFCPNSYDIFRVYRAFDDNGNQVVETQIIHVVDEVAPQFTFLPQDTTVSCSEPFIFGTPTIQDECGQSSLFYETIESDSTSECFYQSTRVWYATDECGNLNIATQTITFQDNTPPIINGPLYVELENGEPLDSVYVTSSDICSQTNITYTDTEVSGGNIIRNYTSTDNCGNSATFEQIIHHHSDDEDEDGNNRVAICHRTGNGSYHTIYVAPQAVPAHLAHGDYLGPCTEIMFDWQSILPNSDLEMRVIKGYDNKYKKFVKVK